MRVTCSTSLEEVSRARRSKMDQARFDTLTCTLASGMSRVIGRGRTAAKGPSTGLCLRALAALLPALVLAGAAAPRPAAAATELVVNGSFEEPALGGGFSTFGAIPGWTTTFGPGIEIQNHAAGDPLDG